MPSFSMSRVCALLFLLLGGTVLSAQSTSGTIDPASWKRMYTDGHSESIPGAFPVAFQNEEAAENTVEFTFALNKNHEGPVGLVLYKNNMSIKVYVNGSYIESIGRGAPDFFFQPYISRGVLINEALLKETNTVRLVTYNDDGIFKLRLLNLMDEASYKKNMRMYEFLDVQLPRLSCIFLLFVSLYCIFYFLNYREKTESLFLSFGASFFALYLLNVSIADAAMPYLLMKALLYACFPVSILFMFDFFKAYFKLRTDPRVFWGIRALGLILAAGYFFQKTSSSLDSWHSIMLVYPTLCIVYGCFGGIKSILAKKYENIIIIAGLLLAIFASAFDMYFFFLDRTPFILLQGIGVMSLIVATFYAFSQETADANKKVLEYSIKMEENRKARELLFERIKVNTERSEGAASMLNQSIERVGALVTEYIASIEQINASIESQHGTLETNKANVDIIIHAIDQTSDMITQHEQLVTHTVQNIQDLAGHINETNTLIMESGDAIGKMSDVCRAAAEEVTTSSQSVKDLANYSKNINEIVQSISDLSAQTNILSINAAIEAARSGSAGKGFAVVAGEIRSLAERSSGNVNKINDILRTMVDKIENIQVQEERVSARLDDIGRENVKIQDVIKHLFETLEQEVQKNKIIGESVEELVRTVHAISEQSGHQMNSSDNLKTSMDMLDEICSAILVASSEQKACNDELSDNLAMLQRVSEDNVDVLSDLKELIA